MGLFAEFLTRYPSPRPGAGTTWTTDLDGLVTKIERATGNSGNPWVITQFACSFRPIHRVLLGGAGGAT